MLPDPKTRIRRMDVTSDDMIWFGDWSNGKLVRFNPKDGSTKEYQGPGGQLSQPYGMTVIDDVIWYCESNVRPNTLVRFDPKTEKFQTWAMPDGGGIVRHMMPTRDGNIAMALLGHQQGRAGGDPAVELELTAADDGACRHRHGRA